MGGRELCSQQGHWLLVIPVWVSWARECPVAWPGWGQTQARWVERGKKAGVGGEVGLQPSVCRAEL